MAYTQAHNKANQRYQKKAYDSTLIRFPKGYIDSTLKPAAERAGESVNAFVQNAISERIDRLASSDAKVLTQVVRSLAEAPVRPYTVTFHTLEQLPTGRTKLASGDAQKVVEASSEADAKVVFFKWLKEQMKTEVAFEDSTMIGMKRDDGVIEICEIESVE